jgi:hypothetical protein
MHGEGGQSEQPSDGGGRRERPKQDTGQRNAERPAPPPPQRETRQRPACRVYHRLLARQRVDVVEQKVDKDDCPERDGEEESDDVDGPVASCPRTDRLRLGRIDGCQQRGRPQALIQNLAGRYMIRA